MAMQPRIRTSRFTVPTPSLPRPTSVDIPLINICFLHVHVILIFRKKGTGIGEVTHPYVDQLLILQCLKLLININAIKTETDLDEDENGLV